MTRWGVVVVLAAGVGLGGSAGAATVPGYVVGVFAGQPDSANILPNFNKVQGTAVANLDIPVPQAILTHGLTYVYTVALQSAITGTCKASYSLTQLVGGTNVVLDSHTIASFPCTAGGIYAYYIFGKAVPNNPGPAVLNGVVTFGTTKASMKVPVVIQ